MSYTPTCPTAFGRVVVFGARPEKKRCHDDLDFRVKKSPRKEVNIKCSGRSALSASFQAHTKKRSQAPDAQNRTARKERQPCKAHEEAHHVVSSVVSCCLFKARLFSLHRLHTKIETRVERVLRIIEARSRRGSASAKRSLRRPARC